MDFFVADPAKLKEKQAALRQAGKADFWVVSDFDKTLTKAIVQGKAVSSLISILRDGNYLTPDYPERARAMFEKYHPYEIDSTLSREERQKWMRKWYKEHFDLLVEAGLTKKDVEQVVASADLELREGVVEFLDFLRDGKIPLVIMSASGLGEEAIKSFFKKRGVPLENITVVANRLQFDAIGKFTGVLEPIIPAASKTGELLRQAGVASVIEGKESVLLLGDSLDDLGMLSGLEVKNLVTVGFFNYNDGEAPEEGAAFEKVYDTVIRGQEADFSWINDFLRETFSA